MKLPFKVDYNQQPWEDPRCPGDRWRRVGDVDEIDDRRQVCVRITESSAVYVSMRRVHAQFTEPGTGKVKTVNGRETNLCRCCASRPNGNKPITRLTEQELTDFLAGKVPAGVDDNQAGQENDSNMKNRSTTPARGGLAAANRETKTGKAKNGNEPHSRGKLGELMGHSVVAVLRRLGHEGVTAAQARGIMKERKIKASDTTVSIQVSKGANIKKSDDPALAKLTGEQLKELKSQIPPEPKKEEKKEEAAAKS